MKGKKKMLAAVLAGALTAAAALTALGAGPGGRETAVEVFEDASFDAISCRVLLEADLGSEYRTIGEKEDCLRLIYSGLKGREGEPAVSREPTEDGDKTVLWVTHDSSERAFFEDPIVWEVRDGLVTPTEGE